MNFFIISLVLIVEADLLRDSTLEGNSFIDFIDKMSEKDLAELLIPSKYGIFHRRLFKNIKILNLFQKFWDVFFRIIESDQPDKAAKFANKKPSEITLFCKRIKICWEIIFKHFKNITIVMMRFEFSRSRIKKRQKMVQITSVLILEN